MQRLAMGLAVAVLVALPMHAVAEIGSRPLTRGVSEDASERTTQEELVTEIPGLDTNLGAPMDRNARTTVDVVEEPQSEETGERPVERPVVRPGPVPATPPGPAQIATPGRPDAPPARVTSRRGVEPPPAVIEAENGQTVVFAIAYAHLNRVVTPFRNPEVKTTSTANIATDRGIIYVSTTLDEPVAMFVHDADDPEHALSLTMVPAEIPPVSTRVNLVGYTPPPASVTQQRSEQEARAYEVDHPYPQMLTTLMRDLALGRIPDGYGFEELHGPHPAMVACQFGPGVWVEERQLATGASLMVFVAKVTNRGEYPVELHEEACAQDHVRAVAAWPKRTLMPGEATELFVAVDAGYGAEDGLRRPSVLSGGP